MIKNWPTIVSAIAAAIAPVLVQQGVLTVQNMGILGVIAAPLWTFIIHRLSPPVKGQP